MAQCTALNIIPSLSLYRSIYYASLLAYNVYQIMNNLFGKSSFCLFRNEKHIQKCHSANINKSSPTVFANNTSTAESLNIINEH